MQKPVLHRFTWISTAWILIAATVWAVMPQCPRCGYENPEGAASCSHCNKPLPGAAPVAEKPQPAPERDPSAPHIILQNSDIRKLQEEAAAAARNGDMALAVLIARNGLALAPLSPGGRTLHNSIFLQIIKEGERRVQNASIVCWACKGKGLRTMTYMGLQGEVARMDTPSLKCQACEGRGRLPARPTEERLGSVMAKAGRALSDRRTAAGQVEVGGAWLPQDIAAKLTARDTVLIKTASASVCLSCQGFGFFGCERCEGVGRAPCKSDCVMGRVVCEKCGGKRRVSVSTSGSQSTQKTCGYCAGLGVIDCESCKGRGYAICESCEGSGEKRCTDCKGTGEQPLCTKCEGQGIGPCKACKGLGQNTKGVTCPVCQGEKEAVCTSCNGTGHQRSRGR